MSLPAMAFSNCLRRRDMRLAFALPRSIIFGELGVGLPAARQVFIVRDAEAVRHFHVSALNKRQFLSETPR